jgi:hypothetical protein
MEWLFTEALENSLRSHVRNLEMVVSAEKLHKKKLRFLALAEISDNHLATGCKAFFTQLMSFS